MKVFMSEFFAWENFIFLGFKTKLFYLFGRNFPKCILTSIFLNSTLHDCTIYDNVTRKSLSAVKQLCLRRQQSSPLVSIVPFPVLLGFCFDLFPFSSPVRLSAVVFLAVKFVYLSQQVVFCPPLPGHPLRTPSVFTLMSVFFFSTEG